jgi:hypothetical protein
VGKVPEAQVERVLNDIEGPDTTALASRAGAMAIGVGILGAVVVFGKATGVFTMFIVGSHQRKKLSPG